MKNCVFDPATRQCECGRKAPEGVPVESIRGAVCRSYPMPPRQARVSFALRLATRPPLDPKQPRELSEVRCPHLVSIGEGETPVCCGGHALVDLGTCSHPNNPHGLCSIGGREIDGKPTKDCLTCGDRPKPAAPA